MNVVGSTATTVLLRSTYYVVVRVYYVLSTALNPETLNNSTNDTRQRILPTDTPHWLHRPRPSFLPEIR